MDSKVTGWIDTIINTAIEWGNNMFEFFGLYTSKYSKYIIFIIGGFVLTKMLNIKINLGGGRR